MKINKNKNVYMFNFSFFFLVMIMKKEYYGDIKEKER